MSTFQLKWELAGEQQLGQAFVVLAQDLTDFRVPFEDLAKLIYRENAAQFAAQGRPAWEKLSDKYAAWKARHFPGLPIMQRTGALLASLTQRNAAGSIFRLTADELEIGTSLQVDKYNLGLLHQKPTPGARPQRRLMVIDEPARDKAYAIFESWFERKAREAGIGK
jgi:phage gpG-like protein